MTTKSFIVLVPVDEKNISADSFTPSFGVQEVLFFAVINIAAVVAVVVVVVAHGCETCELPAQIPGGQVA